jgi:hypothetical protein
LKSGIRPHRRLVRRSFPAAVISVGSGARPISSMELIELFNSVVLQLQIGVGVSYLAA